MTIKKEKIPTYKIKKKGLMIALRVILWVMLGFFFVNGIMVTLRPDTEKEALNAISAFKSEFSGFKELDSELLAFAEKFAVEYLTYSAGNETDYQSRLSQYSSSSVTESVNTRMANSTSSKPLYVRSYRKEAYSDSQFDVYVSAIVLYSKNGEADPETDEIERIETQQPITLRIPVFMRENRYIVESPPLFINDDVKLQGYEKAGFGGKEIDKSKQSEVLAYLSDFFNAYYSEKQSIIDNYLAFEADKSEFQGLDGVLTFKKIEDVSRVYFPNETDKTPLIAVVTLTAADINGNDLRQNFTVTVVEQDGRYYVLRLDTRIVERG